MPRAGPAEQIVALGRPGAPGSGPLALYDQFGTQVSGYHRARRAGRCSLAARPQHGGRFRAGPAVCGTSRRRPRHRRYRPIERSAIQRWRICNIGRDSRGRYRGRANTLPGQQLRAVIPRLNIRQSPSVSSAQIGLNCSRVTTLRLSLVRIRTMATPGGKCRREMYKIQGTSSDG